MKLKYSVLSLLLLFISFNTSWSIDNLNKYYFEHLFIEEGLYFDPIIQIVQDKNGLLWFGTSDGLHRYDGYKFISYRNIPSDTNSLSQNRIEKLFIDRNNNLWVVTHFGHVLRYSFIDDNFTRFYFEKGLPVGQFIKAIAQDHKGTIFLGNIENGLFYIDEENKIIRKSPFNNPVTSLSSYRDKLFIGSKGTLLAKGLETEIFLNEFSDGFISVIEIIDDLLWVGTQRGDLVLYSLLHQKIIKKYNFNNNNIPNQIFQIKKDSEGQFWLLTESSGVYILDNLGNIINHLQKNEFQTGAISDNQCFSFLEDKNGVIWIGTSRGINKYNKSRISFSLYRHIPNMPHSLSDSYVSSIFQDKNGNLIVATKDGKLNIFNKNRDTNKRITVNVGSKGPLLVRGIFQLGDNHILLGTDIGLVDFFPETSSFQINPAFEEISLAFNKIRKIVRYDKDRLLITSDHGLLIYNLEDDEITQHLMGPNDRHEPANSLKDILVDENKNIWIGNNKGFFFFDISKRKFKSFTFPHGKNVVVMSILKVGEDLFLGTFNEGLYRLQINKESKDFPATFVEQFTKSEGLPNEVVYSLIPDNRNIWISTNKGLSRMSIETKQFTNFDINDGLQSYEYNIGAAFKTREGEIFFGGINGLNSFYPEKINKLIVPGNIVFTNLMLLNKYLNGSHLNPSMNLTEVSEVSLAYDENFISINFTSTNYSNPKNNNFYYKLDGVDENWIFSKSKNTATYTNLSPGIYTFRVKAVSQDFTITSPEATLKIHIVSPFWQKPWFYSSFVLLAAVLGFFLVRSKLHVKEKEKQILELQILSRTKELLQQKEIIEAQYKVLKNSEDRLTQLNYKKDLIFSILSHDLRSPLTTLQGYLNLLIQSYDSFSKEEIRTMAEKIKNSVSNSLDLLDNILYWSLSQMGSINYNPKKVNVATLVNKTVTLYALFAENKKIELRSEVTDKYVVLADENMMLLIIRNLVSNALKYTQIGGKVIIKAYPEEDYIGISVSDNGVGIEENIFGSLFEKDFSFSTRGTQNEKGTGLGLYLCKEFAELNHGQLTVASKKGEGSTFTLFLKEYKSQKLISVS
jgi:signal transduction histidine kinase/ligand-binding sensor domain-containing protein